MDEIDLKLLRLLQKNARTPIKTLAGEVRLSSPAVSARIERLEKQGVIRAYTLDLDPLQLGHPYSRVHPSGYAAHPERGILSVHCRNHI